MVEHRTQRRDTCAPATNSNHDLRDSRVSVNVTNRSLDVDECAARSAARSCAPSDAIGLDGDEQLEPSRFDARSGEQAIE